MSVASTILAQLGGNKFRVMTGAKDFIAFDDALSFSLPSRFATKGINKVKITLNFAADAYTMHFYKVWGTKCTLIQEYKGVYCDQLQELFKEATGLDTHL